MTDIDSGLRYRCPQCGGEDLRAQVQVPMTLYPNGDLEVEDSDAIPGNCMEIITSDPRTCLCNNEHCEHEGAIDDFMVPL